MSAPVSTLADHPRRYCPCCRTVLPRDFRPGPAGRPDAVCPDCRSLERDRFLSLLLAMLRPALGHVGTLLEVSPSRRSTQELARLGPARHLRLDLGADNRLVDVLGSLTRLPLADESVDLMLCYHVLEHIPDDAAAMREMARVLAPSGLALVQVPWRPGRVTDEDPSAPEAERLRRFGQADHVRYYGADFEDRLVAAGLTFTRVTPTTTVGKAMVTWCRLRPQEPVWLVRPGDGTAPVVADRPGGLAWAFDATLEELVRSQRTVRRLRRRLRDTRPPEPGTVGTAGTGGRVRRLATALRPRPPRR